MRLEADGLVVARGGKRILDSISASFLEPGLIAVIGPNGAGKSTLLLTLAGLLKPDVGVVALDGTSLAQIEARTLARRRAYLPQNARCEWPISVENAIALGLTPFASAFGDLGPLEQERVVETLVYGDLADKRAQPVTTLSGGELARTMLARAMVGQPEILVADEPVAGLDPRHALDAMRRLRALADSGRLVIVALHDLALAAQYADRILGLQMGRVVVDGAPDAVFTPALLKTLFEIDVRITRDAEGIGIRFVDVA